MEIQPYYRYFEPNDQEIPDTEYDFGYIYKNPEREITNYVTCKILPEPFPKRASIELICLDARTGTSLAFGANPENKLTVYEVRWRLKQHGTQCKELLNLAEQKAKELGITSIMVQTVGMRQLLQWYESQGYVYRNSWPLPRINQCLYILYKKL
jgi:hypothetical protein